LSKAWGANWGVKDAPTPEPSANQVLIKVHANGVYHTDAFITKVNHPAATTTFPRHRSLTEASQYSRTADAYEKMVNGKVRFRAVVTV